MQKNEILCTTEIVQETSDEKLKGKGERTRGTHSKLLENKEITVIGQLNTIKKNYCIDLYLTKMKTTNNTKICQNI